MGLNGSKHYILILTSILIYVAELVTVSPRLFPRFEPKKGFLKKARPKCAFGSAQNATFIKILRFGLYQTQILVWLFTKSPFWAQNVETNGVLIEVYQQ